MSELPASLLAKGLIARWQAQGCLGVQLKRGDADRGLIWVIVERPDGHQALWSQAWDTAFRRVWRTQLEEGAFLPPEQVRAKLEQERSFDPDLWILVLELGTANFSPETHLVT